MFSSPKLTLVDGLVPNRRFFRLPAPLPIVTPYTLISSVLLVAPSKIVCPFTYNLEFMETSPPTDSFWFMDTSAVKILLPTPPIIAACGIELLGYCAYRLPQISMREPVKPMDISPRSAVLPRTKTVSAAVPRMI